MNWRYFWCWLTHDGHKWVSDEKIEDHILGTGWSERCVYCGKTSIVYRNFGTGWKRI